MSDKFYSKLSALQDPHGILKDDPRRLHELRLKHSKCITNMFARPENGGDPFMFALVQPKPNILVRELNGQKIDTAATDGRVFYWNPDFLEKLDHLQTGTVLKHEKGHVFRFHCSPDRGVGWDPELKNIAYDYIVNGSMENDHIKSGRSKKYPLFGGPLGDPLRLKDFLDWIDAHTELPKGQTFCYSDPALFERTADSIYYEIEAHVKKSPRRCKKENGGCGALTIDPKTGQSKVPQPWAPDACKKCGARPRQCGGVGGLPKTLDTHMQSDGSISKEEVMADLMKAADFAKQQRGTVPAEVEGLLKELREPTLSAHDMVVNCFQRRVKDVGDQKDYTRFVRRPQYIYTQNSMGEFEPMYRLYQPRNFSYSPTWACLLDTSGSISEENIADGVKELKIIASLHDSRGWIIPCDSTPKWKDKVEVTTTADLHRTKVVGRGGTTFRQFFEELPQEMGTELDLVVVITDGWIDTIPPNLAPNCEVIWVITSNYADFKPPFGRSCPLYPGVKGV